METTQMRQELHQLVEKADDEKLKLLCDIAKDIIPGDEEFNFTEEEIAEFERRSKSPEKSHTIAESMAIVRGKLKVQ